MSRLAAACLLPVCLLHVAVPPARGQEYAPDRVVVRFDAGVVEAPVSDPRGTLEQFSFDPQSAQDALEALGIVEIARMLPEFDRSSVSAVAVNGMPVELPHDMTDVYVLQLPDTSVAAAAAALSTLPYVRYAEPDYVMRAHFDPGDEYFDQQWWLENSGQIPGAVAGVDIEAPDAWNTTTGFVPPEPWFRDAVGILDTGIDYAHDLYTTPDGELRVGRGHDFTGSGSSNDNSVWSHGTAVAGIVGAIGDNGQYGAGINWEVNVMSIKVLDANGNSYVSSVCSGVEFARQMRTPVINMSMGGGLESCEALRETIRNVHAAGVLVVASMGNQNADFRGYPAIYENFVFAVGAVYTDGERWDDRRINLEHGCDYPNLGSNYGPWIDIAAPGGRSIATLKRVSRGGFFEVAGPCDEAFGGTSAAAPVVSGVASLVRSFFGTQENPLVGEDLEQILIRTARDVTVYGEGFDIYTGWGVVDARAAVEFVSGGRVVETGVAEGVVWNYTEDRIMRFHGVPGLDETRDYPVKQWEFRQEVFFETPFAEAPDAWAKSVGSEGWSAVNPHVEEDLPPTFSEIIPGSVTPTGMLVRTYFFQVFDDPDHTQFIGWYPRDPTESYPDAIQMAWTAIGPVATTGFDGPPTAIMPTAYAAPNPLRSATTIHFHLPEEGHVVVQVVGPAGRLVRELEDRVLPAGKHAIPWDARTSRGQQVAPGMYFLRLTIGEESLGGKLVVLR